MNHELLELPLFDNRPAFLVGQEANAFWLFHRDNPEVYSLLTRLAREWRKATGRKIGIKAIFERARWEYGIQTNGGEYQLNNNHTAYYARLIMHQERDLAGLFNLRQQMCERGSE